MLSEASAFASIVGLITTFVSNQKSNQQTKLSDFKAWLEEHRHEDLIDLLESNQKTAIGIKALLNKQGNDLQTSIDEINGAIAMIAHHMPNFSMIAESIVPGIELSNQAVDVLRQVVESDAREIMDTKLQGGVIYHLIPGSLLEFKEAQFIEEDFSILTKLGFFTHDRTPKGSNIYKPSRAAYKFIANTNKESSGS